MRLQVLMFHQDDPKKCTAAKMVRFGLARSVRSPGRSIVLDPFADRALLPADRLSASAITGVDCSWRLTGREFSRDIGGTRRRLPPLLAGNPVNYSKLGKLTTAEALSASLFILGLRRQAFLLLDKFRWGHTFYELNQNLLGEYAELDSQDQIPEIARQYGLA